VPAGTADAHFWDRIARKYANDPIKDMVGYERTLERTCQLLRRTDNVLELGCGTGSTALRLAAHVRHILATDLSDEMITIAREKASALACDNAEFRAATPDGLPAGDGSYDAVLAFNLLHLVPDRASALQHIHRLLKPDALFISKTPCLAEMNPLIRLAVPLAQWIGKAPYVSFFSAVQLEHEIESAGFSIVEQARHGAQRKDARIFIAARRRP
jgi:ubiquinone/menaquinone biosynthesis C-methylase UbiE